MPATVKFHEFTAICRDRRWRLGQVESGAYRLARLMIDHFNALAADVPPSELMCAPDTVLATRVAEQFGGRVTERDSPRDVEDGALY